MKYTVNIPVEFDIPESSAPTYQLLYVKLNGVTDTYPIKSITYMDNSLLKAVVVGKGYRSFKTDRIVSLVPITSPTLTEVTINQ